MLQESEPRRFPAQSFELLDSLAARLRPDDPALGEWLAAYWRRHRTRLVADLGIIEQHVAPGSRVLECGAVPPLLTAALAARGYQVSAVDIAPERFGTAIAELGLDVRRCDIETDTTPFASARFDAAVFNEILEHLRINPVAALREVGRVLRPGGLLLLSTPNLRSFRGLRSVLVRHRSSTGGTDVFDQYDKLDTLGHMGHVREYTAREVSELVERVGFRVVKTIFRGGHGRGVVGLAERLAPTFRPFFSLIAERDGSA